MNCDSSEITAGVVIVKTGERIYVDEVHIHPKHGREFKVRRGSQPPMWYSARHMQRWLDDAVMMDIPLEDA